MYTESCKHVREKTISKSQQDSCGMIAVSLADNSVPGRPDIPDRLLEWALKITCQLTPRGPSQEGIAQPLSTWHSQFPGTLSHMFWKCHMFRINSSIFGMMKTHLFASWS